MGAHGTSFCASFVCLISFLSASVFVFLLKRQDLTKPWWASNLMHSRDLCWNPHSPALPSQGGDAGITDVTDDSYFFNNCRLQSCSFQHHFSGLAACLLLPIGTEQGLIFLHPLQHHALVSAPPNFLPFLPNDFELNYMGQLLNPRPGARDMMKPCRAECWFWRLVVRRLQLPPESQSWSTSFFSLEYETGFYKVRFAFN